MANIVRLSDFRRKTKPTFFTRPELNLLLALYSRQVARGVWRDYGIGQQDGKALFSVFRHTNDSALYTIIKINPGGDRKCEFVVLSGRYRLAGGTVLSDVVLSLQKHLRKHAMLLDSETGR